MGRFKVGDEVLVVDDGAWNGILDKELRPEKQINFHTACQSHDLQGCRAEVVGDRKGEYVLKLLNYDDPGIRYITMPQADVEADDHLELAGRQVGQETKPVKSDGGSSSYYDIPLPEWLVDKICQRGECGQAFIKTEELIEAGFGNDFDAGNIQKSLVRAWGAFNGSGKEGNSLEYEVNKIRYSLNKLLDRKERGE